MEKLSLAPGKQTRVLGCLGKKARYVLIRRVSADLPVEISRGLPICQVQLHSMYSASKSNLHAPDASFRTIIADVNGDLLPDVATHSSLGVTVGQLMNHNGVADFYRPLRMCGDGVVSVGQELCDAKPKQHPFACECA